MNEIKEHISVDHENQCGFTLLVVLILKHLIISEQKSGFYFPSESLS